MSLPVKQTREAQQFLDFAFRFRRTLLTGRQPTRDNGEYRDPALTPEKIKAQAAIQNPADATDEEVDADYICAQSHEQNPKSTHTPSKDQWLERIKHAYKWGEHGGRGEFDARDYIPARDMQYAVRNLTTGKLIKNAITGKPWLYATQEEAQKAAESHEALNRIDYTRKGTKLGSYKVVAVDDDDVQVAIRPLITKPRSPITKPGNPAKAVQRKMKEATSIHKEEQADYIPVRDTPARDQKRDEWGIPDYSDLPVERQISKLTILALKAFPSSPRQKEIQRRRDALMKARGSSVSSKDYISVRDQNSKAIAIKTNKSGDPFALVSDPDGTYRVIKREQHYAGHVRGGLATSWVRVTPQGGTSREEAEEVFNRRTKGGQRLVSKGAQK